ncbi:head protein [Hyalangium rubrum]|uniref:Head protein n=1 Tax=Hyalangium rubrum TaxID=3103134 RepID=A0ABU5HEI9_9BACT|nr:head protein [Hyalangium sp. s54d21]MDY7231284.1 head protein [Hyalangium sp. s54d21]
MNSRKLTSKAKELLAELRAKAPSEEQQELLDVLFDALLFIDSTGQLYAFEDYRQHLASNDPPRVVASFDTREEAEAWLQALPEPPSSAYVLIADRYHLLSYNRELKHRRLFPHPVLEYFLGARIRDGLPPPVASFATKQEAEAWFENEAAPPQQAVITISGEPHLAVYHPNIHHRALYPFSMAAAGEEPQAPLEEPSE